ncbi:MAG: response regulator transcription factor [Chitinophagaceae bacterium]
MDKISILLVDDHRLLRETWETILNSDPRFEVIASTGDAENAIEIANTLEPHIIVMDISMTPVNGIEATRQITNHQQTSEIICVSMHNGMVYAKQILQAGAKGYLTKNSSKEELIIAIVKVSEGSIYLGEDIRNMVSPEILPAKTSVLSTLTARQIEIILLLKEGLSSKQVSHQLKLSWRTVQVHRYNILKKLKVKNIAALINFANINGL